MVPREPHVPRLSVRSGGLMQLVPLFLHRSSCRRPSIIVFNGVALFHQSLWSTYISRVGIGVEWALEPPSVHKLSV